MSSRNTFLTAVSGTLVVVSVVSDVSKRPEASGSSSLWLARPLFRVGSAGLALHDNSARLVWRALLRSNFIKGVQRLSWSGCAIHTDGRGSKQRGDMTFER